MAEQLPLPKKRDLYFNKQVIEMREINRMSYKDISDKLNLNLSTVKSQIRNGRAILVKETKKEFDAIDEMYM